MLRSYGLKSADQQSQFAEIALGPVQIYSASTDSMSAIFAISLVGRVAERQELAVAALIDAVAKAHDPELTLIQLEAVQPATLPTPLLEPETGLLDASLNAIDPRMILDSIGAEPLRAVALTTQSPIILTSAVKAELGLAAFAPSAGRMVRALLPRLAALWPEAYHLIVERPSDRFTAEAAADRLTVDSIADTTPVPRYHSSRQSRAGVGFLGFRGRLIYRGTAADLQASLPILALGAWTQVGSRAALGFGAYTVSVVQ